MRGQASRSSASDHIRHPLIGSEGPAGTFTYPTSQLVPPHSVRSWHSLTYGCLPSVRQMNQPHPIKPTPKGSDSETTPQEDNGLVITQHQARKTSLGWINGKL